MFHNPAIDGTLPSGEGAGTNRFARNGYGAPRVPREYCPSSAPSFIVASSIVPYSSKLSVSDPFSNEPVVDVTLSSPLKKEPFAADAAPASSIRNGTSMPPTVTAASHSPAIGGACAAMRPGCATSAANAITLSTFFMASSVNPQSAIRSGFYAKGGYDGAWRASG